MAELWRECASSDCSDGFEPNPQTPQQIYHSPRCKSREERRRWRQRRANKAPQKLTDRQCPCCAQKFTPNTVTQVYCSKDCRDRFSPMQQWAKKTRAMHAEVRLVECLEDRELEALARWPHLANDPERQEMISEDVAIILDQRRS